MVGFIHMKTASLNERFFRAIGAGTLYALAIHYIAPGNGMFNFVVLSIAFMFLSGLDYFDEYRGR